MKEFYPFEHKRPGSDEIFDGIENAINAGKKFIILEALTGAGKGGYAIAYSRKYKTPILTATKLLQEQYVDTKEFWQEYSLKGKSNYMCAIPGQETTRVDEALCCSSSILDDNKHLLPTDILVKIGKDKTTYKGGKSSSANDLKAHCIEKAICPYYSIRKQIGVVAGAIINYDLFFTLTIKSNGSTGIGLMSTQISKAIVFDEAHQIIGKIQEYFGCSFTDVYAIKLLGKMGARLTNEDPILWIKRLRNMAQTEASLESDGTKVSKLKRFADKISISLAQDLKNPAKFFMEDTGVAVNFKPLDIKNYKNLVFGSFDHVLIMSATLQPNFREVLGITDAESVLIRPKSTFAVKNRPIIFPRDIARLNKTSILTAESDQYKFIAAILAAHKKDKGIIHCSSYKFFDQVRGLFRKDDRFIWVDKDTDKNYAIKKHMESKDPTILVSPAMLEGVDLKDDLARFQIMLKVPYSAYDDYMRKLIDIYPTWYDSETATNLVQAYGRAVRSEQDRAVFYILDGTFNMVISKSGYLLSPYFKEAVQTGNKESLMKILEQRAKL